MVGDLPALVRIAQGRCSNPTAVIFDARTLKSTPESGAGVGFDGHKKRKGSKIHMAVDMLGKLLALTVTLSNEQDRAQVAELATKVQAATYDNLSLAYVDQGYTGPVPAKVAHDKGIELREVRASKAKHSILLMPRSMGVERSLG